MSQEQSLDYFTSRARASRDMAAKAATPAIAAIHLHLANRYDAIVRRMRMQHLGLPSARRIVLACSSVDPSAAPGASGISQSETFG
jgi:hypothetical protein